MIRIVIFSKDRAMQLHSLLESIRDHLRGPVDAPVILYRASDAFHVGGYELLQRRGIIAGARFLEEQDFRRDVLSVIGSILPADHVMFLVDDNIVFRPVDLLPLIEAFSPAHLFISLRADRAYSEPQPSFMRTAPFLEWRWRSLLRAVGGSIWTYPFSVDGNVFHAGMLQRLLPRITFRAPNSLEGAMQGSSNRLAIRFVNKALAPVSASVFNNPLNQVQGEGSTWHQGFSARELNEQYLAGRTIHTEALYAVRPAGVHHAAGLQLQPIP